MRRDNAWVLVADNSKARVYRYNSADGTVELLDEIDNPSGRMSERELGSDKPGRSYQSNAAHRNTYSKEHSLKDAALGKFLRSIAVLLEAGLQNRALQRLVIVAGPNLLGRIRKELGPRLEKCVVGSVTKDLVHLSEHELLAELSEALSSQLAVGNAG